MICKCMDRKGLAAMLISIQSAGVTPEVNLRITTGKKPHKYGIHNDFETQGKHHQKSKMGVLVTTQRKLVSFKIFKKCFQSFLFFSSQRGGMMYWKLFHDAMQNNTLAPALSSPTPALPIITFPSHKIAK